MHEIYLFYIILYIKNLFLKRQAVDEPQNQVEDLLSA